MSSTYYSFATVVKSFCQKGSIAGSKRFIASSTPRHLHRYPKRFYAETATSKEDSLSLHISDSCVKQMKKFKGDDIPTYLRILVEGGGCSGFQYKFELDSKLNSDDKVFEKDGVKVAVDIDSMEFLKGATVDYEEELIRSLSIKYSIDFPREDNHGSSWIKNE